MFEKACHFAAYKTILKNRRQIGNYPSSIKNSFRIEEIAIYVKKIAVNMKTWTTMLQDI